ncbi:MAG: methylated-DNA--[protein]-cysteine S-methyltransferase [Bacteroidales bacterium]|nr:methylated-DNA--[protein]-cysteine S-methyltransferase [Bacteroidales bacterium]
MLKVKVYEYVSPCGKLWLAAKRGSLCLCEWANGKNLKDNISRLSKALDVEFILPETSSTQPQTAVPAATGNDAAGAGASRPLTPVKNPRQEKPSKVIALAIKQLGQYFSGRRKRFNIPYMMAGTPFQESVWKSLMDIPYGKSISYADIAAMAGHPKAVRAAANACGDNAISIIIPCHRVIGSDTGLTGYGGGLGVKRYLLDLESEQQRLPFKTNEKKAQRTLSKKKSINKPSRKSTKSASAKSSKSASGKTPGVNSGNSVKKSAPKNVTGKKQAKRKSPAPKPNSHDI